MEERNHETDSSKIDEVMLPGFRFHPTDEELVGFYLRRKIQNKALSIELIKQLDIYKYDPWDLPKLATVGEKEWYFFCPRDRKYRNSTRPNRVTGAGFWKATGTDRPIYSSEGSKCIGLKKSLVFYKGRAAKGTKTDWMMHEFRLPSITDSSTPKRYLDKNIPPNDSWAICRIFKKANSNAHRALSHSWVSPQMPPHTTPNLLTSSHFTSNETSFLTKASSALQFSNDLQNSSMSTFSPLDLPPYRTINPMTSHRLPQQISVSNHDSTTSYTFSNSFSNLNNIDASSLLLNMSSSILGSFGKASESTMDYNNFTITLPENVEENNHHEAGTLVKEQNVNVDHIGFPDNGFPLNMAADAWKSNLLWESSPCPSDQMSTSYSTNKCYT